MQLVQLANTQPLDQNLSINSDTKKPLEKLTINGGTTNIVFQSGKVGIARKKLAKND